MGDAFDTAFDVFAGLVIAAFLGLLVGAGVAGFELIEWTGL